MTEHHLRAMKRLTGDVRLAYDSDKAGVAATERAIGLASQVGVNLTVITLSDDAKDPDELIHVSPKKWQQAIDNAIPAVEWVLQQYAARTDLTTAAGKREFTTAGLKIVATIGDVIEQEYYQQKIAELSGSSLEAVQSKLAGEIIAPPPLKTAKPQAGDRTPVRYVYEDDALAVAAIDGPSQELFVHTDLSRFHGEERQALAKYYASHSGTVMTDTPKELQKYDTYVKIVLLRAEEQFTKLDSNERYYETARLLRLIEHEHKKQTQTELIEELRDAEYR